MRYVAAGLFAAALAVPSAMAAQTDEEQIVDVAEALFSAMLHKDGDAIQSLMIDGAQLLAVDSRRSPSVTAFTSGSDFLQRITGSAVELNERMWDPKVRIDGDIAQLWTSYDFYAGGTFSHCGIDAFHMVRTAEGWKIGHITYNRRTTDCYSPLGPPR